MVEKLRVPDFEVSRIGEKIGRPLASDLRLEDVMWPRMIE